MFLFYAGYLGILFLLILCRAFGQINGAYAWIQIGGGVTLQPSEFAKVFMIGYCAKLFGVDRKDKNINSFLTFGLCTLLYFFVIVFIQHDFGSGIVLFVICYCMMLIPNYPQIRKYQRYMTLLIFVALAGMAVLLSDPFTEFLKAHSDNNNANLTLYYRDIKKYVEKEKYTLLFTVAHTFLIIETKVAKENNLAKFLYDKNTKIKFKK
jgi:cell division protein FtsW (lipid II flippase)